MLMLFGFIAAYTVLIAVKAAWGCGRPGAKETPASLALPAGELEA
jgi:hypothetical protein